jgi:GNAT superfamily N-acetyltransferase
LIELLRAAASGRFPAADGEVSLVPRPPGPASGVIGFTGHHVVAAEVDEAWLRARLPPGDLSAPMTPAFLAALGDRLGRQCRNIDAVLAAPPLEGDAALVETDLREHPRVLRALAHRDHVRVFAAEGVTVTLGRGFADRLEVAFEVDPAARGAGLGRAALLEARRLAGEEPLFAQTSPGNAASLRALLGAGFAPIGSEALFFDRAAAARPSVAVLLTGAPGAGKSSVLEALTTLLSNAGVEYGAIESEQLGWGSPWLPEPEVHELLATVVRRQGRDRFLAVATTETAADLEAVIRAIGASRTFVACLAAPPELVRQRVLDREPEAWQGRIPLAEHAFELASVIPRLPGVDLVADTEGRRREDVAAEIRDALAARGLI